MKPTPENWTRISSALVYRDAAAMIDWLCKAFGFEVRLKIVGDLGQIEHSELTYGEGLIMVGREHKGNDARYGVNWMSPLTANANTQMLMVHVDDVDAHCAHARASGAVIASEPEVHDYGDDYWSDKSYGALDPEGHLWWFAERLRSHA